MTRKKAQKHVLILALLAMAASFLSNTTPLWLKQVEGAPILVCSTFGTRTVLVDENGKEVPAPIELSNKCLLCLNASDDETDTDIAATIETVFNLSDVKAKDQNLFVTTKLKIQKQKRPAAQPRAPPFHLS